MLVMQQLAESFRRPAYPIGDDNQASAKKERAPKLPNSEIEGKGMKHGPGVSVAEAELISGCGKQPQYVSVRYRDAFWLPR